LADIQRRGLRKHAGHWCNGLILRLLQITHRQWTFRCGTVHLRGPDGLTSSQRDRLAQRCEDLLWTDPSTLLEDDRYLLALDFEDIGAAPSDTRQAWISEMEAARCAATYVPGSLDEDMTDDLPVPIDSEGSIRFQRRRRRRSLVIERMSCSISRMEEVLMSLWPRLLLCVRG
jgi:hypothetical protein